MTLGSRSPEDTSGEGFPGDQPGWSPLPSMVTPCLSPAATSSLGYRLSCGLAACMLALPGRLKPFHVPHVPDGL